MSVLHDVFISHASEDKDDFVRPLAERLRDAHLEVWYDEFSLRLGDSLRRSIDRGLAQSRFGIVVLSPNFIAKQWSQWELDGLVARQNSGQNDVILPIWHQLGRDEVLAFSPPLADKVAVASAAGLDEVVARLTSVIRPQGSTLISARDYLLEVGFTPPVISDDWWLDVAAAAESNEMEDGWQEAMGWGRWGFPLPPRATDSEGRGLRLAWAALQREWQREADDRSITQITRPEVLHEFLETQIGLLETCQDFPLYAVAYAPQLTIRGFGGPLEDAVEALYQGELLRSTKVREELALRAPGFAGWDPSYVACSFVMGDTVGFGPPVRYYEYFDYVAWLLSDESTWLPPDARSFLTQGMAEWAVWPWHPSPALSEYGYDPQPFTGTLATKLMRARKRETFHMTKDARADLIHRLTFSTRLLGLPEDAEELAERLDKAGFIDSYFNRLK